jgi:hypothetical protein
MFSFLNSTPSTMKQTHSAWWLGAASLLLMASCDTARTATDTATTDAAASTAVEAAPSTVNFTRDLTQGDYRFQVQGSTSDDGQQLTIRTRRGDALVTDPIRINVRGNVSDAVMGDLNGNGNPELYVFTSGSGSGSFGGVEAYEFVDRSFRPITAPPKLSTDLAAGYNGQDKYEVRGTRLVRTYPVTGAPDGATSRTIEYSLNRDGMLMPVNTPTSSTSGSTSGSTTSPR